MKHRVWLGILTLLVMVSLLLNGILIFGLLKARDVALNALTTARNTLAVMGNEPITTSVHVNHAIPLNTVVPIDQTIHVPLDITYPLSTVVTTYIEVPVLGRQDISIPIETSIPIEYDLTVPVAVEVPISMTYVLEAEVPISFEIPPEIRSPLDKMLQQAESALR